MRGKEMVGRGDRAGCERNVSRTCASGIRRPSPRGRHPRPSASLIRELQRERRAGAPQAGCAVARAVKPRARRDARLGEPERFARDRGQVGREIPPACFDGRHMSEVHDPHAFVDLQFERGRVGSFGKEHKRDLPAPFRQGRAEPNRPERDPRDAEPAREQDECGWGWGVRHTPEIGWFWPGKPKIADGWGRMTTRRDTSPPDVLFVQPSGVVDHLPGVADELRARGLRVERQDEQHRPPRVRMDTRVVVVTDVLDPRCVRALRLARKVDARTVLLMDGLVEWRNTYTNPRVGDDFLRPAPVDVVCCSGLIDARTLTTLGNTARPTGLPRIDARFDEPTSRNEQAPILVATANTPAADSSGLSAASPPPMSVRTQPGSIARKTRSSISAAIARMSMFTEALETR